MLMNKISIPFLHETKHVTNLLVFDSKNQKSEWLLLHRDERAHTVRRKWKLTRQTLFVV